ncbi:MAG: hypothetical protein IJB86_01420 [Clostridia bacterium]|nr:hypothetical protein [Clostridia bacterium]
MGKVKYIISRIKKMNASNMPVLAKKVSDRSGKPRLFVMADMVWCGLRYRAGFTDYELFNMERANGKQRKTYVTRGINDDLVSRYNDAAYRHIFVNKDEFNEMFGDFLHRDWMKIVSRDSEDYNEAEQLEKLEKLCKGKKEIVAKPRDEMCGKGIEMINPADYSSIRELYDHLQDINAGLIEDSIVQHPQMNLLYPDSINTLRMVTLNNGKAVTLVLAVCRMGNGARVDNFLNGGMMTRINTETGELMYDAVNAMNDVFSHHPVTGTKVVGFRIPMWDRCVETAKKAALVCPQVGYVGWDIAVTPDGPVLVEGNEFPGHCLYQLPPHTPDNYGVLPLFTKAINATE